MRNVLRSSSVPLLLVVLIGAAMRSEPQSERIPIGTVIYSLLDEQAFRAANGDGWRLLSSTEDVSNTDLCTRANVCSLPDGRGVFIRGMNLNRDGATGDPDGARVVRSYQADVLKNHHHYLNHDIWVATQWNGLGWGSRGGEHPVYEEHRQGGDTNPQWLEAHDVVGGAGPETRPRNIALYIYVKVKQ
jgi:hypothetical protein